MPTEEGKPYHQQGARCGETTAQVKRRRADPLTDSWADRMESDVEDPMDYSKEVCHVIFGPVIFCPEGRNMIAIFGPDKI